MPRILSIILIVGLYAACATTPQYENISFEDIAQVEASAEKLRSNHDYLSAAEAYLKIVSNDLRRLRDVNDLTEKKILRAHLEYTGLMLYSIADSVGNHVSIRESLSELNITADDGGIYEFYCHLSDNSVNDLGYLHNFEFVGPFDNERGIAFDSQLAAETNFGSEQTYKGKVRDVSWRTTPSTIRDNGLLNMGQLLHPNRQSAVLMRTWVYSDASRNAHAVIGVKGEVAAWCNGQAILEARGQHDMSGHNFSAPLSLKAGWNELNFKLGSRDHSPMLRLRLVTDNSANTPLLLEHRATTPDGATSVALESIDSDTNVAPQQLGALKFYREINDDYHSGILEMAFKTVPRSSHPGRAALASAVEGAPDNLIYRNAYARNLFPKEYESAEEIDLNPWLHQSQIISEQSPDDIGNIMLQLHSSLKYQYLKQRSLELAKRLVALSDSSPMAMIGLSLCYEAYEYYDSARRCLQDVLNDPESKNYPYSYRRALYWYNTDSLEFIDGMKGYYAEHNSTVALKSLIDARRRQRDQFNVDAELEELEAMMEIDPWNTSNLCTYALRILNAGDNITASQLLDRAVAIKPENATIWHHKARVALQTDNLESAVACLERELEIDYSDETEQRLLEMINSAAQEESFEAPYREDLAEIVTRHPLDALTDGYSLETLLRRAVVKVSPDSTAKRYYRDVVRILNEEGVRRMARKGFGVRWGLQDLRVLTATVLHNNGRTTDIPVGRGYRARVVEFPNLKVGDIVDVEYRIDDLRTSFFGTYFSINHPLAALPSVPTRESALTLITDNQLPLQLHTRNLTGVVHEGTHNTAEGVTYDWATTDIMPLKPEAFMPHATELTATIQASSYNGWSEFGDWWWNLIKDGITVSDELAAKVTELTAGLETKQQKLKVIYEFVTNEIRYNAWEFGVHGYQPYTAPVIFSRRFGDCKDKAILLRAMLSEVDIEALPVLIMRSATQQLNGRRPDQDLSLAMVEHFNHCIAYVPEQDGLSEQYIDGTANLTPLETLPYDDRGAQVVVIGPDGSSRKLIPFKEAAFNVSEQVVAVELRADGSALVDYTNNPFGSYDNRARSIFANGLEQNQETMRRMATSFFGGFDGELEIHLPLQESLSVTPSFGFSGNFTKWAAADSGVIELDASFFQDNMFNQYTSLAERDSDVVLQHAYTKKRMYRIALPPGYGAELLDAVNLSNAAGSYSWNMTIKDSSIAISEELVINAPRITVADYSQFRKLCRTIDDTQNLLIHIAEVN
jgi:tetratricopeptide (TPR) repeat protein